MKTVIMVIVYCRMVNMAANERLLSNMMCSKMIGLVNGVMHRCICRVGILIMTSVRQQLPLTLILIHRCL
jgi:hypothetical protein